MELKNKPSIAWYHSILLLGAFISADHDSDSKVIQQTCRTPTEEQTFHGPYLKATGNSSSDSYVYGRGKYYGLEKLYPFVEEIVPFY